MRWMIISSALLVMVWSGCKTEENAGDTDLTTVVDHVYAERGLLSITPLINALKAGPGAWDQLASHTCAQVDSIVGDTAAFPGNGPVIIYMRYPDPGCVDIDGRTRSGAMRMMITGELSVPGTIAEVNSTDLTVDGKRHRFGMRDSIAVDSTIIVRMDSSAMFRGGDWSRTFTGILGYRQVAGTGDAMHENDIYRCSVDLDGQDHNGLPYTATSSADLMISIACKWVTVGEEVIIPEGKSERYLDYGAGACDANSAITVEDEVFGLTIP